MDGKQVCVVVGVGPGNGAALARRFAAEGWAVALLARGGATSDALAARLPDARAFACDVTDPDAIERVFDAIAREMGPVRALLYHALTGRMPYDDGGSLKSTLAKARDVNFPPVERFNAMAPPRLATLQKRAMSRRPHERPTVTEFRTSLQQWIRQSGNVDQARHCVELARLLVHRAQLCSRREHEVKTDCYLQALAQYDRGLVLCEEMPGVVTERAWVLREFIEACVVGGDITLARLLERHNRLPVGRLSPGGVEKPSEGEAALDQITGKTTTTRRARRQPR